ncbi:hypothetical protein JCM3774_004877 [Rhodotorula dairenensis]
MATTSPPASPSKRPGLLRSLVTGIDEPVDRDAHAQRWHRAPAGPRSPNSPPAASNLPAALAATGARESKVRSLVQGWEQASLGARSRPYEVLAPAPASPYRTTFEPRDIRAGGAATGDRPALRVNSNHLVYADEATSPRRGTSPTVPAAYFQMQAAKRTVDAMPAKFDPQQQRRPVQPGKENHRPSPGSGTTAAAPPRLPQLNMAPLLSASTMSARTDLTADTDTGTAVTVETMATRSSGSTHAASLLTTPVVEAFADEHAHPTQAASRGQEAKRFSTFSRTATQVRDQQDLRSGPPPFARPQSSGDTTPEPSRPVLQYRPVSSFIEALPPRPTAPSSAHSSFVTSPNSATSSSAQHAQERPARYSPLPLDCASPLTPVSRSVPNAPPAPSSRRRPRSSSAGEGARPAGIMQLDSERAARPAETAQEKASRVDAEFARLLDTMQLPDQTVRTRMLGLALPLKEEMLRTASSASPSLKVPSRASHQRGRSMNTVGGFSSFAAAGSAGDRNGRPDDLPSSGFKSFLRKAKSNSSLRSQNAHDSATTAAVSTLVAVPSGRTRSKSRSRATSTSSVFRGLGKSSGAGAGAVSSDLAGSEGEGPTYWASRLRTGTIDTLQVKELGRLRGRLRNESPAWIGEFVTHGGYVGLLARLKDLLEKEWREEQHDDQVLHEVLRCFKALTMTNVGKRTLATYSPTPFLPLTALLFSEKRPGDLPCRQILVELVHALFQICPSTCDTLPIAAWSDATVSLDPPVSRSSPVLGSPGSFASSSANSYENGTGSGGVRRYTRRAKMGDDDDEENLGLGGRRNSLEREEIPTPDRVQRAHRFVVSLMRGPPDEDEEAKVDFMKRAHRERVYKVWVKEIADCVRDYFWVFCHANNLFWTLEQIDAEAVEAPKVPSGMTGGVEYEAMAYCTAHLRLINEIARTCPSTEAAFAFHEQLFLSGFERVLFTLRRASLVYYQALHLEMSRYISLARGARFNLGPRILACLDRRFLRPEEQMVLHEAERKHHHSRSGAPQLGAVFSERLRASPRRYTESVPV